MGSSSSATKKRKNRAVPGRPKADSSTEMSVDSNTAVSTEISVDSNTAVSTETVDSIPSICPGVLWICSEDKSDRWWMLIFVERADTPLQEWCSLHKQLISGIAYHKAGVASRTGNAQNAQNGFKTEDGFVTREIPSPASVLWSARVQNRVAHCESIKDYCERHLKIQAQLKEREQSEFNKEHVCGVSFQNISLINQWHTWLSFKLDVIRLSGWKRMECWAPRGPCWKW